MSAPTEIPWTQTITLNAQDNIFIAYLEQKEDGTGWQWKLHTAVVDDREYLRNILYSLRDEAEHYTRVL